MVGWTRRVFLRETMGGWAVLLIGPVVYGLMRRWARSAVKESSNPMSIGLLSEFPKNSSRTILLGGAKVIIGRSQDGTLHAVSAVCTHLGCSVRYEEQADGPGFTCNCHSSRFGLQGENLTGPAPSPLQRYSVRVEKGEVWVSRADGAGSP